MKTFFKITTLLFFLWFGLHTLIIIGDGLHDDLQVSDVGIVLGNKVEKNGQPSRRLQSRLDKAVELYRKGYFRYLIVSGGIGKEGYDEAKVMKNYLVMHQIPGAKIFSDQAGNNTYLTARNAKRIMTKLRLNSVLVITQYYHISRAKLAFYKAGFHIIHSAHANIFELRDIYSLLREFVGYYKYLFV